MVLKLNRDVFTKTQRRTLRRLKITRSRSNKAIADAYFTYTIGLVGIAREKAPLGTTGSLRASAFVEDPEFKGSLIIIRAGFKAIHARMRDIGTSFLPGGVLRPVVAEALFIPLRAGASPNDPSLIQGIDFVLAKEVKQEGNRYWTGTLEEQLPQASRIVGRTAFAVLKRRVGGG